MLPILILSAIGAGAGLWRAIYLQVHFGEPSWGTLTPIVAWALGIGLVGFLLAGFFTLEPNRAAVLLLFGAYKGTIREAGFHWANPLYRKTKVSLRTRNFNTETLKVNDNRGNPIEIAAIVVWRVEETAQAAFDVDDYQDYVTVQSESAVRHLASEYPYDTTEGEETSLRGSMEEVARDLLTELQERLGKAGVIVEETRLSHLAYAPEIAGAMLRRQQAEAIVAARRRIVEGAVGMVELALEQLEEKGTVELDDERKASMVSNLLVVLCGDHNVQPVVNTGTLYS
jgi:regulator of protease activity HflC (stomatin/prohibitin superfamily)